MKYTLCPFPCPKSRQTLRRCQCSSGGCSCSSNNHPRKNPRKAPYKEFSSSPIQNPRQQQQQPQHVWIGTGIGIRIGIALRLSSALCATGLGTRVPFCRLLRLWLGSWLVARPTTFWVSVWKCTWLNISGLDEVRWVVVCALRLRLRMHCDFHGAHANVENAPLWHWRYAPATTMRQGH